MRRSQPATAQQERIVSKILNRAKQRGITQEELAARAGVSRETVSRMKRREADFGTVAKLAAIVGFKLDVLEDDERVEAVQQGLLDIADFGGNEQ